MCEVTPGFRVVQALRARGVYGDGVPGNEDGGERVVGEEIVMERSFALVFT